jgi:hypothetical protein
MSDKQFSNGSGKLEWIEPALLDLDIAETANLPGIGSDGNIHADCTRS